MERKREYNSHEFTLDPENRNSIHFYRATHNDYAITSAENNYVGIMVWSHVNRARAAFIEVYAAKTDYPVTAISIPNYSKAMDFEEFIPLREELLRYAEHVRNREFLENCTKDQILEALRTCLDESKGKKLELPRADVPNETLIREMISKVNRKQFTALYYAEMRRKHKPAPNYPMDEEIDRVLRKWAEAKVDMYRLLGDLSVSHPFPMKYSADAVESLFTMTASKKYPRLAPLFASLRFPFSLAAGSELQSLRRMIYRRYDTPFSNDEPFSAITAFTGESYWKTALSRILNEINSKERSIILSINPSDYLSLVLKDVITSSVSSLYGKNSILLYDKGPVLKEKHKGVLCEGNTNVEIVGGAYFSGTTCDLRYYSGYPVYEAQREVYLRASVEKLLENAYGIPSDWIFYDDLFGGGIIRSTLFYHNNFPKSDVAVDCKF